MKTTARLISQLIIVASMIAAVTTAFAFTGQRFAPQAKVTLNQARAIALKAFPGTITDQELEKEKGGSGLRYSFDIRRGRTTHEVGVDARSGRVLENSIEGPHSDQRYLIFVVSFVMLTFRAGVNVTPTLQPDNVGILVEADLVDGFFEAVERGSRVNTDLSDCWDHWALTGKPLERARGELGVPTLGPGQAYVARSVAGLASYSYTEGNRLLQRIPYAPMPDFASELSKGGQNRGKSLPAARHPGTAVAAE